MVYQEGYIQRPFKLGVFNVERIKIETILLHSPECPAPTNSEPATDFHCIRAWLSSWPSWTWVEFRADHAERLRDILSGAHASMLHGGDIIVVRSGPTDHGDYKRVAEFLFLAHPLHLTNPPW